MGLGTGRIGRLRAWLATKPVKRGKARLINGVEDLLTRYAEFALSYPRTLVIASIVVCMIFGLGFLRRETDYDMNTLYSLKDTESRHDEDLYKDSFPESRFNYVVASSASNMLTRDRLEEMKGVERVINNLRIRASEIVKDETGQEMDWTNFRGNALLASDTWLGFEDLCVRDAWDECERYSVYNLYMSKTVWGNPIVLRTWPFVSDLMKGKHYRADAILGGMTVTRRQQGNREMSIIESATAVGWRFDLRNDGIYGHLSAAWEARLADALQTIEPPEYDISVKTHRSLTDELRRMSTVSTTDALRIFAALGLLLLYTVISLMSCNHRSKLLTGVCGTFAALMGYAAGSGLCYWMGLHHVPPCEATPFLVMGIGVDDMFVLINSYSLTYPVRDYKSRICLMIRDAGLSITLTTITNILAFAIGMASPYYSISVFCITTSVSLLFGYVLVLTFFLPILCMDAARETRISNAIAQPPQKTINDVISVGKLIPVKTSQGENDSRSGTEERNTTTAPSKYGFPSSSGSGDSRNVRGINLCCDVLSPSNREANIGNLHCDGTLSQPGEVRSMMVEPVTTPGGITKLSIKSLTPSLFGSDVRGWRSAPGEYIDQEKFGRKRAGLMNEEDNDGDDDKDEDEDPGATPDLIQRVLTYLRDGYQKGPLPGKPWWPEPKGNPGRRGRDLVCTWYAPLTGKLWWKLVVLCMIIAYIGSSIWGLVHLQPGLGFREITPDDSYLREFYDVSEQYFAEYGQEVIVFDTISGRNWSNSDLQKSLNVMTEDLEKAKGAQLVVNGLNMFIQSHPNLAEDEFVPALQDWVENDTMGKNHKGDIFIEDGQVARWRFHYWMPYLDNSQDLYNALEEGKDIIHESFPEFHAYTQLASLWESDPRIISDTAFNLGIALAAIVGVCCILLPSWRAAAIVVVTIVMIDIGIMGYMHFWGLKLNLLTMVSLLISVGYSVDYTVHFVHCYGHKRSKDTQKRLTEMLTHITVPVTHGALSSFVAITMLSGSDKHVVYVFFQMLTLVLSFAWLNGTIFIPIYFSVFLPYKQPKTPPAELCNP